jgi:hypothetical protein
VVRAVDGGEEVALAAVIDTRADFGPRRVLSQYVRRGAEHARNRKLRWAVHLMLRSWLARLTPALTPARFRLELAPGEALARATSKLRRRYRLRRLPAPLTVVSTIDYDVPPAYWANYRAGHALVRGARTARLHSPQNVRLGSPCPRLALGSWSA